MLGCGIFCVAGGDAGDTVFDMEQADAIAIFVKKRGRIDAGLHEPIDIDFEFDKRWVGVLHDLVEA